MNLMELEKILYGISMDSVFMSRPENGILISNLISTAQSIQNAATIVRSDMRNDGYKMTMNNKIAELENAFVTAVTQRLLEFGIPIMNSYNQQPMMQHPQYGQPMQQQYGQPMQQQQYGQPMQQQQYGQPMQQQQYGQPMHQQYGQPMQQQYGQPMQQQTHQPQPVSQPMQQQHQAAPAPSQQEPPRKSSTGPIAFGDDTPLPGSKSATEKKSSASSGAGVFGMDGGTLPGAKKNPNEPAGSAAGRDFLLSLLEKQ